MERDFLKCGGGFCTARLCGGSSWCPWVLGCPMLALTPPVSVICDSIVVHCFYFFCHCHYFGVMPSNGLSLCTLSAKEGQLARNMSF